MSARQVEIARECMARGYGLNDAARRAKMSAADLDVALWRSLGTRRPQQQLPTDPAKRDELFVQMVLAEAKRVGLR